MRLSVSAVGAAAASLWLQAVTAACQTRGQFIYLDLATSTPKALQAALDKPFSKVIAQLQSQLILSEALIVPKGTCLTVQGGGQTTSLLNGGNSTRHFTVEGGGYLELTNLTLLNGNEQVGGAIMVGQQDDDDTPPDGVTPAQVALVRVTATENSAALSGGAMYIGINSTGMVKDCDFNNNFAAGEGTGKLGGGAIWSHGQLDIVNSVFSKNQADRGSSLYIYNLEVEPGFLTMVDSRVSSDSGYVRDGRSSMDAATTALSSQAALYTMANTTLTRTTFENNRHNAAGAILIYPESEGDEACAHSFNAIQCVFKGNEADYGGAIWHMGSKLTCATYADCIFDHNNATSNGAAMNLGDNTISHLTHCNFTDNFAGGSGAAIYLNSGPNIDIEGGVFERNEARGRGGAVFSKGSLSHNAGLGPGLGLLNVKFQLNQAWAEGGAIKLATGGRGYANGCHFVNNSALDGGAVHLAETQDFNFTACAFGSNTAKRAGASILQVGEAKNFDVGVDQATTFIGGSAQCCYIDDFKQSYLNRSYTCIDVGAIGTGNCCPVGSYIETPANEVAQCVRCDDDLLNCTVAGVTSETLPLLPGLWRADAATLQSDILECWNGNACLGGHQPSDYCATGYQGPYCAVCEPGWSSFLQHTCYKCGEGSTALFVLLLLVLLVALVVAFFAFALADSAPSGSRSRARKVTDFGARIIRPMRIPLVVYQVITQYLRITGSPLPDVYRQFVAFLDFLNFDLSVLVSTGCVWTTGFYDTLLIATLLPLGVLAALTAARVALGRSSTCAAAQRGWRHWLHSVFVGKYMLLMLVFTFLIFSASSMIVLQTFSCDQIAGTADSFLRADYSIQCYTPTHKRYMKFAVVMIFVYPIGIPALYAALLWRQRHGIMAAHNAANSRTAGPLEGAAVDPRPEAQVILATSGRALHSDLRALDFLWRPYKSHVYYWEVVECGRRLLLTGVLVFIAPQTVAQSAYASVFAYGAAALYLSVQPHLGRSDAALYGLGQAIIFLTFLLSLLTQANVTSTAGDDAALTSGLMIFLNAVLFAVMAAQIFFMSASGSDEYWVGNNAIDGGEHFMTLIKRRVSGTSSPSVGGGKGADGKGMLRRVFSVGRTPTLVSHGPPVQRWPSAPCRAFAVEVDNSGSDGGAPTS